MHEEEIVELQGFSQIRQPLSVAHGQLLQKDIIAQSKVVSLISSKLGCTRGLLERLTTI